MGAKRVVFQRAISQIDVHAMSSTNQYLNASFKIPRMTPKTLK